MDEIFESGPEPETIWPPIRASATVPSVLPSIFSAYHAARHRLESAAREHGLDATETMVLVAIRRDPMCAPWGIRRRLGFARSTMTSILDRLERSGHVTRRAPEFSRQRFELVLTRSGEMAADVAEYAIAGLEAEIAGCTSPADRRGAISVAEACRALDRPDRPHP